ncbi:PP270 [Orf virus]|uniref:PP270 n=1 Tax=Orf virus TaxID=10258 RepID=F1AXG9_ORFV|nr:PP270 [Orf virus]
MCLHKDSHQPRTRVPVRRLGRRPHRRVRHGDVRGQTRVQARPAPDDKRGGRDDSARQQLRAAHGAHLPQRRGRRGQRGHGLRSLRHGARHHVHGQVCAQRRRLRQPLLRAARPLLRLLHPHPPVALRKRGAVHPRPRARGLPSRFGGRLQDGLRPRDRRGHAVCWGVHIPRQGPGDGDTRTGGRRVRLLPPQLAGARHGSR